MTRSPLSTQHSVLSTCVVLLGAFALRVYRLADQSVWWDEGYSADLAGRSLLEATRLTAGDIHPPLYYWLLHVWVRLAGDGEFALRFLSVLLGVLLVAAVARVGRRLVSPGVGLAAAIIAAASPFYLAYSQEARMYVLETLLALGSAYLAYRLVAPGARPTRLTWGGYVLISAAGLYADYFVGLVLVAVNLWAAIALASQAGRPTREISRRVAAWAGAQFAILVLFLPWLGTALGQIGTYGEFKRTAPPVAEMLLRVSGAFNAGPAGALAPDLTVAAAAAGVALLGIAGRLPFGPSGQYRPLARLWMLVLLLGTGLLFLGVMKFRPFFHIRYLLVATPAYYLLLGAGWAALTRLHRPFAMVGLIALGLVAIPATQAYFLDPALARDDTRAVGTYLRGTANPDDLVLYQTPQPFQYYYRGPALALHLPVRLDRVGADLAALSSGRPQVFWATWYESDLDPWAAVPYLLDRYGRLEEQRGFRGYDVARYSLSGPLPVADLTAAVTPTAVDFGPVVLTGFDLPRDGIPADRAVTIAVRFRGKGDGSELKFSVRLVDEAGDLLKTSDRPILNEARASTDHWLAGETGYGFVRFILPPGTPPGDYPVELFVYRAGAPDRPIVPAGASRGAVGLRSVRVDRAERAVAAGAESVATRLDRRWRELAIVGYDWVGPRELQVGDWLKVSVVWRAVEPPAGEYLAGLVAIDRQGRRFGSPGRLHLSTGALLPGDLLRRPLTLLLPGGLDPGPYEVVLALDSGDLPLGAITVRQGRARDFSLPGDLTPAGVRFGDQVELVGYRLEGAAPLRIGERAVLTLYWRALSSPDIAYTVFTQILDTGQQIRGQHDGPPKDGQAPTTSWISGEVIEDRHELTVSPTAPSGPYELRLGLYDARTGKRLPVGAGDYFAIKGLSAD